MVPIISCREEEGEIRLLSNSLAPSVVLCFLSPFFFLPVCSLNPLIKRHFESVAGVCWVTARPLVGRSLCLFCRFPLSKPSHSSAAGFWCFRLFFLFHIRFLLLSFFQDCALSLFYFIAEANQGPVNW